MSTTPQLDKRTLMAQREGDTAEVKTAKWDFHSLARMERDYTFNFSRERELLMEYVFTVYQALGIAA